MILREFHGEDPLAGHLYVFASRRRDRVKVLYWDRDGLALWYKRLERGTFPFPSPSPSASLSVTPGALAMLLDGLNPVTGRRRAGFALPPPEVREKIIWKKSRFPRRIGAAGKHSLKGVLHCGHCGCAMTTTYTRKQARMYRYYLCLRASKMGRDACPVKTVSAGDIEAAVTERVRLVLRDPNHVDGTLRAAEAVAEENETPHDPLDLARAVQDVEATWDALFPVEQARIVRLLVERVTLRPDGLAIDFADHGLRALAREALPERTLA